MKILSKSEPKPGFVKFVIFDPENKFLERMNEYSGFFSGFSIDCGNVIIEFYNQMTSDLVIINDFESEFKEK